jgi:hypothetical protein
VNTGAREASLSHSSVESRYQITTFLGDAPVSARPLSPLPLRPAASTEVGEEQAHIDDGRPFMELPCEIDKATFGSRCELRILEGIPMLSQQMPQLLLA